MSGLLLGAMLSSKVLAQTQPVVSAAAMPGGGIALSWTGSPSEFLVQYAPELGTDPSMDWVTVVATTDFSTTIPAVPGSSEAYYRVVSLGESSPLADLTFSSLQFFQLNIVSDTLSEANSDWGAAYLTYNPSAPKRYFNLSINNNWVVQNIPLFPGSPLAARFDLEFDFDLGVTPGTPVNGLAYGYSLTPNVVTPMPPSTRTAPVSGLSYDLYSDVIGQEFDPSTVTPGPYFGGNSPLIFACRTDVPNQHCGTNECGPAAVSNNLQWLNAHYHLNIPTNKLTIDYWKTNGALGFTPGPRGGVPLMGMWAATKQAFVDNKNNMLPIDSHQWPGAAPQKAVNEFNGMPATKGAPKPAEQAVEITIGNHVAAVICMGGPDGKGNFTIVAASDAAQGGPTGMPINESITIDGDGNVLSGADKWGPKPLKVENFVVQCPHPNKFP